MLLKIKKWWYFHIVNPVISKGEQGAFRWRFRRFWLEIGTLSGNFKVRFTAAEYPYGYLLAGDDDQVRGFAQRLYEIGMLMCTEQRFVDDLDKALENYAKRAEKRAKNSENEAENDETAALEFEKEVQEATKMSKKEQKKVEKRFRKVEKKINNEEF